MEVGEVVQALIETGNTGIAVICLIIVLRWKRQDDIRNADVLVRLATQSSERLEYVAGVLDRTATAMGELKATVELLYKIERSGEP